MARLEELKPGITVKGILPDGFIFVVNVSWIGSVAIELTYKDSSGSRRIVSRQIQFAEVMEDSRIRGTGYAPYLDYRPPKESERQLIKKMTLPVWQRLKLRQMMPDTKTQIVFNRSDPCRSTVLKSKTFVCFDMRN